MVQRWLAVLVKTTRSPMWPAALSPGATLTRSCPVWHRVPVCAAGGGLGCGAGRAGGVVAAPPPVDPVWAGGWFCVVVSGAQAASPVSAVARHEVSQSRLAHDRWVLIFRSIPFAGVPPGGDTSYDAGRADRLSGIQDSLEEPAHTYRRASVRNPSG